MGLEIKSNERAKEQVEQITFSYDRRSSCSWIFNILWLLIGGWHLFLTWFITGVLLCCTCIGIPCGMQVIKISLFLLFPFGKRLTYTSDGIEDSGTLCCMNSCNCIFNVIWALTAGWILALQAFLTGLAFIVTIIGIPFGWQCMKLTWLCFRPFGIDFTAEETATVTTTNYGAM
mmetsp:Transcript_5640/g.7058  ORF Transcript_5640/g.7058 Transcript_5640/m.7058 type:complete len:174 (+) Transcript_5640:132-653(+)